MFLVELICTDPACAETHHLVTDLADIEALGCACGCALLVVSISEADVAPAASAA